MVADPGPDPRPLSERRNVGLSLSSLLSGGPDLSTLRARPASDAQALPPSSNMNLVSSVLPPNMTCAPRQPTRARRVPAISTDEDADGEDADVDRLRAPHPRTSSAPTPAALQVIPCLRVASLAISLAFYTIVMGFTRYGPKDESQASLYRGQPGQTVRSLGRPKKSSAPVLGMPGIHLQLRLAPVAATPTGREPIYPQMLWMIVSHVDAFFEEAVCKIASAVAPSQGYFPEHTFNSARIATRPQNTPWGTREFRILDPDGNTLVISQEIS